ncbi:hypothetical protein DFH06DRAFT_1345676 [Mycena polygramma]|nr:hypothetical protein DFH06DRAFT_1345676 [Mycena polygramma]
MSFFDHSFVVVQGGTFYSAGGNVDIRNQHQLTLESNEFDPERDQRRIPSATAGEEVAEEGAVAGPVRSPTGARIEAGRFHPYGEIAGSRREAFRPSSPQQRQRNSEEFYTLPSFGAASGPNQNDYFAARPDAVGDGYDGSLPSHTFQTQANAHVPLTNAYPLQPAAGSVATIHNGTFISGNVNNTVSNGEAGIHILHRASASEAFHDPADSHDQPRCHPETRIEMQEQLLNWCLNSQWPYVKWDKLIYKTEPSVLWLHGPAGAGKSAIMRTLSERLDAEGRLGGTFFFKRGHATRGNPRVLFATIALQLAVNCPRLKLRIAQTVENNPTLVGRSIGVQLQELILKPCIDLEGSSQTIVIDGLDECEGHNVQQEIIRLILHSARQQSSLRFIMASRPEAHICETLAEPSYYGLYRKFDVESCFEDVRKYLVAEFARIHCDHETMTNIPRPWPSNEVIQRLISKSSGYFIYASTVIKFVDDKNFRPTRRLEALENLVGIGGDSPFGALDTLYTQILSRIPKGHPLVPILRVIDHIPGLTLSSIDILLRLERGDTELCLRGLHSVIEFDDEAPQFFHASFTDFLRDPSRAGDFYTEDLAGIYELMESSFTALCYEYEDETNNRNNPLALPP